MRLRRGNEGGIIRGSQWLGTLAMPTAFRPYDPDPPLWPPPSLRDWLPEGHLAHPVSDLVDGLDLTVRYAPYAGDGRRPSPDELRMMLKVSIYG